MAITTNQYGLIVYNQIIEHQQDRDIVIEFADCLINTYNISSRSFDKGFWRKENKELLQLEVPKVILPKLGKRKKSKEQEETSPGFNRIKNKHSAIESNLTRIIHPISLVQMRGV